MTGRSTPTNRRHSPTKTRKKTLSGSSSTPPVLDLKEVIDSARINFRNDMKRSKSTMASPCSASSANKNPVSGSKSSSAPASPVKAAHVDSTTTTSGGTVTSGGSINGSKRRAQQPPSLSLMSPKRAKTASMASERSKTDAAASVSSSSEGSSSSSTSQSIRPSTPTVKSVVPSTSSGRGPPAPLIVEQPSSRPSLLTEVKRRKAAPMDEVMKLHMDEGVYHLLHSLPTSRRKTQTALFNASGATNKSSSSPGELGAMKPNSHARSHSPAPVQSQSGGIGSSLKMSAYQRRQLQQAKPRKNNLIKLGSAGVKATTPEALMTPKTLEMLKKLPKKDYVDLWSSKSRYKLAGEALTAAAACSPPLSSGNNTSSAIAVKASSVSPDSSASSDISSASALAAAAKKRQRIGDRMLTCVTHVNKQYKDILIRSYPTFSQIIMCPSTTGLKYSMNVNVFDEITDAMKLLREDESCKAVLLSGLGGVFCQGIDLSVLTFDSTEKQKKSAESLAVAIKLFVKFLLSYPKLLVAALNGTCAGIGVTLLPYFDVIYASDKATLRVDYPRLSQIPEAFASVTMANSPSALRELILLGRTITASEACSYGLISSVVWPDKFLEEIVPRMELLETVTTSGLQMTKALFKDRMRKNVLEVIEEETKMLVACWSANAKNIRQYLKENCGPNQLLFQ